MRIEKWGHSLAIRLPGSIVELLQLREGDHVEIVVDNPESSARRRSGDTDALLERVRTFRGRLPADFRFVRDQDTR
ncbi:AbrB/MazE/SpoVT family DNA-binding domain-containing protein [Cupriavidus gilardii]|uniref:AbrB/MazE/SpoVT family DNA-binding domain-containing protein n=1 Tax=Cupriavidus gilardii TaxID=82541 RepID=UPI001ABE7361|nr:AbrB/MazE/SpoVT family DNA-binding domain-containing protein [Cupriavidus gilardii]MBO4123267.1 AbrB/MazE/SpoVT family DNA-binding domain-containing protein [Cupriavidus gilardii]